MKKLFLIAVLAASLAGCGGGNAPSSPVTVPDVAPVQPATIPAGLPVVVPVSPTPTPVTTPTVTVTLTPPAPDPIPICALSLIDATFLPGVTKQVRATCAPEAASYVWSDNLYGCATNTCPIQFTFPDSYTVTGKNKAGVGVSVSIYYAPVAPVSPPVQPAAPEPIQPTVTPVQPVVAAPPSPEVVGVCSRNNTNHVLTPPSDHGHNYNTYTSHGSSDSFQFDTAGEGQVGSMIREESSISNPVVGFVHISPFQCDFTYPDYGNWDGCGMSQGAQIALQYLVESVNSKTFGKCSLKPYTTYYINIRNEDAGFNSTAVSRGVDTCPEGQTCSFLFQYH